MKGPMCSSCPCMLCSFYYSLMLCNVVHFAKCLGFLLLGYFSKIMVILVELSMSLFVAHNANGVF